MPNAISLPITMVMQVSVLVHAAFLSDQMLLSEDIRLFHHDEM